MPIVDYLIEVDGVDYMVVFYTMEQRAEVFELRPKAPVLCFPAKTPQEATATAVRVVKAA